jgi:DNA-directed RNA polymerase subunit F
MPDPVPISEVKRFLSEEAGRRTLPREASLALQHAELFARLTPEAEQKLIDELRTLPFVDLPIAVRLADTLPQYPEEVRLLLSKERIVLEEAQLTQLFEILAHHR